MSTRTKQYVASHIIYVLKPSRIALVFQLCSLLIILLTFYQILSFAQLLLLSLLAFASFLFFLRQDRIVTLATLDEQDWSIQYAHSRIKQRVHIHKMIDQHFFVVIYFQEKTIKPMIVWCDQLPRRSWKSLKIRGKIH